MISLDDNKRILIVEKPSDLPNFCKADQLFMDFETQNNSIETIRDADLAKKHGGMYPFLGDRICGAAVSGDDCPEIYYIPVRHRRGNNIDIPVFQEWLLDHLTSVKDWVNHNIIFDAVFAAFDGAAKFTCRLVDTLTLSKIHASDRFGHGLKDLMKDWLDLSTDEQDVVKQWLKDLKTKDWSMLPIDVLGEYACKDVFGNRGLMRFLEDNRQEGVEGIWATEIKLTPVLFDMEMRGLQIKPKNCKVDAVKCLHKLIHLTTVIETIADREWTNSNQCIYDILMNQFNLPILATKKEKDENGREYDTGRPTFDKYAMPLYVMHPQVLASEELTELIAAIMEFRKEQQHKSLFLAPAWPVLACWPYCIPLPHP